MDAAGYLSALSKKLVGDPGEPLALQLPSIWAIYNDIGFSQGLYLQYLYTYRDAVEFLMGPTWKETTFSNQGELSINLSDQFRALLRMHEAVTKQIDLQESRSRGAGGVVGVRTATAPIEAPEGRFDANSTTLRGDPYLPMWTRERRP